ncbi:PhzF family phenazine biosynthesis protein [Streptomyces sp. NPDC048696]|uniref:PhzF family phenazine biosynthesis protein n=1 Tax=Streptomyces sp. NPDC048696 TaxID=3365585 RepID=UPI00371AC500
MSEVAIVDACQRDGAGGSPTAVLDDAPFTDEERCRVPTEWGTSHAVFLRATGIERGQPAYALRFFTAQGELPACGHGTVAALALLAERTGGGHGYRGHRQRQQHRVPGSACCGVRHTPPRCRHG